MWAHIIGKRIVPKQGIKGPDIMVNLVWTNTFLGV